jgi:hypothetical protein
MNEIISINKGKELMTLEEWQTFANSLLVQVEEDQKIIKTLRAKSHQLEILLMNKFSESLVRQLVPEEIICIEQIERLHKLSNERALVLDEVKRLDLLVKNLKLIREESTIIVNQNSDSLKEAELVAIIRSSENYQPE